MPIIPKNYTREGMFSFVSYILQYHMSDQVKYLTKEGFEKLKTELHFLKTEKRKEVAWRIQQAKELGDLSENAEYTEAKNEQAFLEGRIIELENIVKNAIIIEPSTSATPSTTIRIGTRFSVKTDAGTSLALMLVGSQEANPQEGRISNESPMGKALLGHKVGDQVEIQAPKGIIAYTIQEIF